MEPCIILLIHPNIFTILQWNMLKSPKWYVSLEYAEVSLLYRCVINIRQSVSAQDRKSLTWPEHLRWPSILTVPTAQQSVLSGPDDISGNSQMPPSCLCFSAYCNLIGHAPKVSSKRGLGSSFELVSAVKSYTTRAVGRSAAKQWLKPVQRSRTMSALERESW